MPGILLLWIASLLSWLTASCKLTGVKRLAVPKFSGEGSHCTARMCLSNHLVCFGILQSSKCVINTPVAQLESLSSREAHHYISLLSIKYQTRERESHKQDLLKQGEHKDFHRCSSKEDHWESRAEVFKLDNLFLPSQGGISGETGDSSHGTVQLCSSGQQP